MKCFLSAPNNKNESETIEDFWQRLRLMRYTDRFCIWLYEAEALICYQKICGLPKMIFGRWKK